MIKKSFFLLHSLIIISSFAFASEPFRVFKTPQGQSLEGRAVGYEGQSFILADRSGKLVQVPLRALSVEDQTYLVKAAQANKIPKGRPSSIPPLPSKASSPSAETIQVAGKGVDFHAEITSEKQAMGHFLDGKATFVVGTHTHTPTLDYRILEKGTAYQTDAGMCGDYNSVIGMNKENAILKFFKKKSDRLVPVIKDATITGIKIVADDKTGLAKNIEPIVVGGNLKFKVN